MGALLTSMFLLGLATSLHCVGMCGPMVVTYAVRSVPGGSWLRDLAPNALYQAARILSYVVVGAVLGAVGAAFNLSAIRPWILVLAGVFMIVLGLGMTGKAPWAARLSPRPPKALVSALSKLRRRAVADESRGESDWATPAAFGLLTGLMPCAPLQGAQVAAAASGSAVNGAAGMLAFGLGTMPLLLVFGATAGLIPANWKHRLNVVLAVVVILFGLAFIDRAALLLGSPVTFDSVRLAVADMAHVPAGPVTEGTGVAEASFEILHDRYIPETVVIPAGRPVRLLVKRQKGDCAHGGMCAAGLVIKRLGVEETLTPDAVTAVELPPTRPGSYMMSSPCGMITGRLVAK
jgi:sulfite exporter TauE/SafE